MSNARDQVQRLLALVPYLRENDGARVDDVAAEFGVRPKQIIADLKVLWFCGLPGAQMGDLIEIDIDAAEGEGVIHLNNADYLARPLRLAADEALALLTALRTLREVTAGADRDAVDRAISKLETAAGQGAGAGESAAAHVHVEPAAPEIAETVNRGLAGQRRLHLTYDVPSRDETTERDVDPMRLVVSEGRTYLEAWCRLAEDVRLFRLDRIAGVKLLDLPSEPPPEATPRDLSNGMFQPSERDLLATVSLAPPARWVAEYYPTESVEEGPDGSLIIKLRVADTAWLQRLVLRLGGSATVLEPAELGAQIAGTAREALAAYDDHL
ncbi:transcriptional regulator protein-like protein [Kribbella flavida DSM 17836]|uniref:Transcriptional regulator protein-like protein n=1 Tax=Kribbella flavida (strain DSM 17836 / JCM 10339 / NBRC 14399) TaxID=479435 RepID=D2Q3J2_KRIFD|nr:WYL domain-containing protein [Kribbella flavida]ADB34115.1 transcriptional regulator protein-like protein [Kribbella flavida DSM 17836]